ncbi:TRAP transporter TatT component family protein, partial [uncultured Thalassolituus sp.]
GKVKTLMQWVAGYDEGYDNATVQVYLGVLESQLPPSVGGKPEIGQAHFEKAIELTEGQHLMAKVLYAKQFARLMFEQELHDRLLQEVLDADPYAEGLTLVNRLAQRQAAALLAESADYFE